jgi:hypothetical protein
MRTKKRVTNTPRLQAEPGEVIVNWLAGALLCARFDGYILRLASAIVLPNQGAW